MSDEALRYPIGQPDLRDGLSSEEREEMIAEIERFPSRLRNTVEQMTHEQLDTPYRDGGWTVRQVIHHVPDSHMNGYIRVKLAMTEDTPAVRLYDEQIWAELQEARTGDIELSLPIIESLHRRWAVFLRSLSAQDFSRPLKYSDGRTLTIDQILCIYAWHGAHHLAHITGLMQRRGW